jgi:hypothetical protein
MNPIFVCATLKTRIIQVAPTHGALSARSHDRAHVNAINVPRIPSFLVAVLTENSCVAGSEAIMGLSPVDIFDNDGDGLSPL